MARERETHTFTSSWVDKAWWDPAREQLVIQFNDGVRWQYEKVDAKLWKRFKAAGSAGQFVRNDLAGHPNRQR